MFGLELVRSDRVAVLTSTLMKLHAPASLARGGVAVHAWDDVEGLQPGGAEVQFLASRLDPLLVHPLR